MNLITIKKIKKIKEHMCVLISKYVLLIHCDKQQVAEYVPVACPGTAAALEGTVRKEESS